MSANSHIKIILSLFLFLVGCNTNPYMNIDTKELENYLETSDITSEFHQNTLNVFISNSNLVKENGKRGGMKWTTNEAYASISALIISTYLDNKKIDTVVLDIKNNHTSEVYIYDLVSLAKVRKYVDVGRHFLQAWSNKDYLKAQSFLDSNILKNYNSVEVTKNALTPIFKNDSIKRTELIAFKLFDGVAGLYINAHYYNGSTATFIFNFKLSGREKIAGIELPR